MNGGKYGSRTQHSATPQYRKILSGEIQEAIAYYKSEGAFVNSIPIWKDSYGNQYTLIQITDRHLNNLIPFLEKRMEEGIHGNRESMDMLHMMLIEEKRRKETTNNIDYAREIMQTQLVL